MLATAAAERDELPLAGVRVAITAARKGTEFAASLRRLGAVVTWGATMAAVPPEQDNLLEGETRALLNARPDWIAISTGSGLRAWLQAAEEFGLREDVVALLQHSRVVARGAKSHGALRAIFVEPQFVSQKETMDDVCSWLGERVGAADVLAAQVHGGEVIGTLDELRPLCAAVVTVAPYRWVLPKDVTPARRVVQAVLDGEIDVLAETSAPSVRNLFQIAGDLGVRDELLAALRGGVCVAAVGSVTARAFEEVGVAVNVMPTRPRSADLLRALMRWAAARELPVPVAAPGPEAAVGLPAAPNHGIELVPDARAVRIGPRVVRFGRQEFAVLAALVRRPGMVIGAEDLALQAWGHRVPDDATQVRHQIARIRRKLAAEGELLHTVRSRGYRYEPPADEDA